MFEIRPFGLVIAAMLLVAGLCDSARASAVVQGVQANSGTGGSVTVSSFTSASNAKSQFVDSGLGNITSLQADTSTGNFNFIELTVTFTELFSDFSISITTVGSAFADSAVAGETYEYLLIMNVVNDMTAINGSTASLNGIDLNVGANVGSISGVSWLANNLSGTKTIGSAGGHLAGGSTGVGGTPLDAGAMTDTQLRFGGFNGGGGGITAADTNSTVLAAVLTLGSGYNSGIGVFDVTFTSNPEPGTMILGGVGLLIGGVGGYRRRRKAKAQTEQAA